VAGIFLVLNSWGFKYKATLCSKGEILMAYAVNSIAGYISGIVAYQDGSSSSYNAELNYDGESTINFTANSVESRTTLSRIYDVDVHPAGAVRTAQTAFRLGFSQLVSNTNTLVTNFTPVSNWDADGNPAADGKVITDMVCHINYIVAFDDGTSYPVSATYEKVGGNYAIVKHSNITNTFSAASNKTAIMVLIKASFEQILDVNVAAANF
jgi:hypothetical protein